MGVSLFPQCLLGYARREATGTIMQRRAEGWGSGLVGVIIFSGSLPATRVAVGEFTPLFLTSARAVIAAALGAALLLALRQQRPSSRDLVPLAVVALGVVIGFPLLTALALQHITSAHSIVFIGLLPLATAIFGVIRGGEQPRPAFWLFSAIGAASVAGFALAGSASASATGDALMVASILLCGLGYAEGARLSRRLGGWQVISWALVVALPVMAVIALATLPNVWTGIGGPAWLGLAYVSVFSMLVGFVFWYRGLALGGIAAVGQLQLLQPFFGLALAAMLLGEPVAWTMIAVTGLVVLCVAGAKRFA
jgi:drug/metabolite transporter (DMT)-like permease